MRAYGVCSEHVSWGSLPLTPLAWPLCPPCTTPGLHIPQQLGRCLLGRTSARKKHAAPSLQGLLSVSHNTVSHSGLLDKQEVQAHVQKSLNCRCWHHTARTLWPCWGPSLLPPHPSPPSASSPAPHPHQGAADGGCRARTVPEGGGPHQGFQKL